MNTRRLFYAAVALVLGFLALSFRPALAEVELNVLAERTLSDEPLDMEMSADGQSLIILVKGKILLYSLQEGRATETIPVDSAFDQLTVLPAQDSTFIALSSRTTKALKVMSVEVTKTIDVSGHPFKGADKAPVVIAVFSDYQ